MKEPKEVAFSFQEINLLEAQSVVAAGDGKYSDLVIMLSKKLPELDETNSTLDIGEKKGFAFGLPGSHEVDEKERRGLCHSVNLRMNKAGILWQVRYSSNKKLFICVPKVTKSYTLKKTAREEGGVLSKPSSVSLKTQISGETLVKFARSALQYNGPIDRSPAGMLLKKVAAFVGQRDLGMTGAYLDPLLGFKNGGTNYHTNKLETNPRPEVELLRAELKKRGVIS